MTGTERAVLASNAPEPVGGLADHALERALRRIARRVRLQRALDAAAMFALAATGIAALALAARATSGLNARPWLLACCALPLLGAALGALQRVPPLMPARLLDRALAASDAIASA